MRYLLASDYGIIGNQFSSALVSNLGSIDWCCFPYLDSPSHFGALIDKNHGGRFQIMPQGDFRTEQKYIQKTQVLETYFETPTGRGIITDWMPSNETASPTPSLCRKVQVTEGTLTWVLTCTPRFRYGMDQAQAEKHPGGVLFRGGYAEDTAILLSDLPLEISSNGNSATAQFKLQSLESRHFLWSWGRQGVLSDIILKRAPITPSLQPTLDHWKAKAHQCPTTGCIFGGPWHDLVARSGLLLKLLSAPYSGAVAESVVLSLKGSVPGSHTWGHRYASIRDGALILQAFVNLGYIDEAHAYFSWIKEILERDSAEGLQSFYTLDGGKVIPERELPYVSGHTSSRQFQLDIYGHIVVTMCEYYKIFGTIPLEIWPKLTEIAEYVCQAWRRPDYGPWSITPKPEHFVISKLFCWAALEQICWLGKTLKKPPPNRWITEKAILHKTICDQGFDSGLNSFVRSFGDREIDTSLLWIPLLNFLPIDDARVQGTLDAIQSQLSNGVLLKRYRNPYELHTDEPVDFWSTFLFITCLALSGRGEEASDRLAEVCTYANPLGLFGDQLDLVREAMPKNFPSANVHLSLINAALYVGAARGRIKPLTFLMGTTGETPAQRKLAS
jgi:GH15 family glucan-1,4-alpha-glucosidase